MKQLLLKARERARQTEGSPISVWFGIGMIGLRIIRGQVALRIVVGWRTLNARLLKEVRYEDNGISLRYKISSSVEVQRVRGKGQPFTRRELATRLKKGGVFYDLGANIGIFTLPAAKIVGERGQVVAFEPEPGNYHRLLENAERNQLSNVTVFSCALGSANKTSLFYRASERLGEGANSLFKPSDQQGGANMTLVARLDDLVELWKLPLPQFMKIDVEGAEIEVLQGMQRTLASEELQSIVCEVMSPGERIDPDRVTDEAVCRLLADYGFAEVDRDAAGSGGHADILFVKSKG